jgi:hypothetical protein
VETGTAKPMFSAPQLMAVAMPTTSPARLTSGPPELPKLIAASVWMKFSNETSEMPRARPLALTTPTVTVWSRASGLPMTMIQSPTRSRSLSPSFKYGRSPPASILSRARSVAGSVPLTSAG